MPTKPAAEKVKDLEVFISNVSKAVEQLTELKRRLEADEDFRKLWESNSAEALRAVGIDPDARTEMGMSRYDSEGAQCNNCITPLGNACHC